MKFRLNQAPTLKLLIVTIMMMAHSSAPAAESSRDSTFGSWQPVGICGGGSMFAPAFSHHTMPLSTVPMMEE